MSVGSDPIECCVRGRFLCVCVTARRRGFRGGLLRRGSEKLLSTCFARLSGIGFAAGGGSARASFSRCAAHFGSCRLFAVGLLRRGSEKLLSTCFARLPGIGFAAGGGIGAGFLFPCAAHFGSRLVPVLRRPAFFRPRTMAGLRSFRTSAGGGGRRAALLPLFTLRRQGSLLEVFSFRQASDESADRIRQVENALHVAALSGRAAAFGGTRGRRGRTVSLDTGEIMSDEREGADAGKRAGARSGPCPQAVAADESPGVGNSAMGGKVKRRRRKPPAFRKKVTPIGLKPITF